MKTIFVFSHLRWNFVFQRPQHLLTRLSKHYRIIFIEEPLLTTGVSYLDQQQVSSNITVVVPHTIDGGAGFNDKQLIVLASMLKEWVELYLDVSNGYGFWFYTPQALPLKGAFEPEFVIFDVMDELSMFHGAPEQLKEREIALLRLADLVIAGGPSLHAEKSKVRPDALNLPSAVDATHFSRVHAEEAESRTHDEDRLEHDIPHPRLGFFGVIDERLDLDLLAAIADSDPHWHVVMIGPVVKIDPATLPQRHNIHWLGMQDYEILPQLVHEWDVCLLPFALNDATRFISPTKTLEYLAAEKPVVSTPIHDVVELYGAVVHIGGAPDQFIEKIRAALAETAEERELRINRSLEIVSHFSWDRTAETVHQAIEAVINATPGPKIRL